MKIICYVLAPDNNLLRKLLNSFIGVGNVNTIKLKIYLEYPK